MIRFRRSRGGRLFSIGLWLRRGRGRKDLGSRIMWILWIIGRLLEGVPMERTICRKIKISGRGTIITRNW